MSRWGTLLCEGPLGGPRSDRTFAVCAGRAGAAGSVTPSRPDPRPSRPAPPHPPPSAGISWGLPLPLNKQILQFPGPWILWRGRRGGPWGPPVTQAPGATEARALWLRGRGASQGWPPWGLHPQAASGSPGPAPVGSRPLWGHRGALGSPALWLGLRRGTEPIEAEQPQGSLGVQLVGISFLLPSSCDLDLGLVGEPL